MASVEKSIRIYEELAGCYEQIGEAQVRDRFLVLAAEAALTAGRGADAETIRTRLLQVNPHHLLKPFDSLAQALQSPDVKSYVDGLRRTYPRENAEQMLESIRVGSPPAGSTGGMTKPAEIEPVKKPVTDPTPRVVAGGVDRKVEVDLLAAFSSFAAGTAPTSVPPRAATQVPPSKPTVIDAPAAARVKPDVVAAPAPKAEAPIPFAAEPAVAPPPNATTPTVKEPLSPSRRTARRNVIVMALYVLVLVSGVALAIYTLIKPFLGKKPPADGGP